MLLHQTNSKNNTKYEPTTVIHIFLHEMTFILNKIAANWTEGILKICINPSKEKLCDSIELSTEAIIWKWIAKTLNKRFVMT